VSKELIVIVSFWLSAGSLITMLVIAFMQFRQLNDMREIGDDTRETALKLEANLHKHRVVEKFFCSEKTTDRFRCIFAPMKITRPLHDIHAGDYYALHHIQTLLGREKLDLRYQNQEGAQGSNGLEGHTIFLGIPEENPNSNVLALFINLLGVQFDENVDYIVNQKDPSWPSWITIRGTESKAAIDYFADLRVPCWFTIDGEEKVKRIRFPDKSRRDALASGVENEYEDYRNSNVNHPPYMDPKRDYAIMLRLNTKSKHKVFVLAGIHQHGTWIAGEFLSRLADKFSDESNCSSTTDQRRIFLQKDCDFAAVVTGDFYKENLAVKDPEVYHDCLWFRAKTGWVKINTDNWLDAFHRTSPRACEKEPE
jgi:hypothetical protein